MFVKRSSIVKKSKQNLDGILLLCEPTPSFLPNCGNSLLVVVADVVVTARTVARVGVVEAPAVANVHGSISSIPHR